MHDRFLTVARLIEADPDAGTPAAEALFNVLLEMAGDRMAEEAVARLRAEPPAMAVDYLTHGFVEGGGPILEDELMRVASRALIALDPPHYEAPRFPSAEDAFSRYQRELTIQRRHQTFAARAGGADAFWQRQIAKQEDAVRSARASWRAAAEKAMAAGETPIQPDHAQREAMAARDGEEALEFLARRYGRAAAGEVRARAVAADDGCTLWSELVHHAAQQVLGAQFEAERWQAIAAMQDRQQST